MASKRPKNGLGIDLSYRSTHMKSQHNKWNAHLAQGTKEMEAKIALQLKADKEANEKMERKKQLRLEAERLDVELGFVAPKTVTEVRSGMPEWKKQKIFIAKTFPNPVVSRRYNNQIVFKNKQSMKEYQMGLITEAEWENNIALLVELRAAYDLAVDGPPVVSSISSDSESNIDQNIEPINEQQNIDSTSSIHIDEQSINVISTHETITNTITESETAVSSEIAPESESANAAFHAMETIFSKLAEVVEDFHFDSEVAADCGDNDVNGVNEGL